MHVVAGRVLLYACLTSVLLASNAVAIPITPAAFEDGSTMSWLVVPAPSPVPSDDVAVAQVSEPATMILVSTGCAVLVAYQRRWRKRRR
jgi:hypothetical protein